LYNPGDLRVKLTETIQTKMNTNSNQMQLSVRCTSAPWENETTDQDRAIDIAYSLSEEYSCDVQLIYTSTGTIHSVVSNY